MSDEGIKAGWYDDSSGQIRWWDGSEWTQHTNEANPEPGPAPTQAFSASSLPAVQPIPPEPQPAAPPLSPSSVSDAAPAQQPVHLTQDQIEQIAKSVLVPDNGNNHYGVKRSWWRLLIGITVASGINILINIVLFTVVITIVAILFSVFGPKLLMHIPEEVGSVLAAIAAYGLDAGFIVRPLNKIIHIQPTVFGMHTGSSKNNASGAVSLTGYMSLLDVAVFVLAIIERFLVNRIYSWKPRKLAIVLIAFSSMIASSYLVAWLSLEVNKLIVAAILGGLVMLLIAPKNFGVRIKR